jgi:preprotein translocase subunit SecE
VGPNKFVHVLFAVGCLLAAFLLSKAGDWVWSYFSKPNELLINGVALLFAVTAAVVAYRNERVFAAAVEVTRELEKVTWPTRKETYAATIVVIVTVAIAALVLQLFDYLWALLANWILHP